MTVSSVTDWHYNFPYRPRRPGIASRAPSQDDENRRFTAGREVAEPQNRDPLAQSNLYRY